ncbi:MAG: hypothetical protein HQK81_11610 [Desulfovibrionaceae bacterium]|nr:hypothetical protein [Desulfovibrionaceae bacterium]MBF0514689.1 hypothetical protein [Desulfovibrionaceae bacterium]
MKIKGTVTGFALLTGLTVLAFGHAALADLSCKGNCQDEYEECVHRHSSWGGRDETCDSQQMACLARCATSRDGN